MFKETIINKKKQAVSIASSVLKKLNALNTKYKSHYSKIGMMAVLGITVCLSGDAWATDGDADTFKAVFINLEKLFQGWLGFVISLLGFTGVFVASKMLEAPKNAVIASAGFGMIPYIPKITLTIWNTLGFLN